MVTFTKHQVNYKKFRSFYDFCSKLKCYPTYLRRCGLFTFKFSDVSLLKGKCMNASPPVPVKPFQKIISRKHNITFPDSLSISRQDIEDADKSQISEYLIENFDLTSFNHKRFINSTYMAYKLMNLIPKDKFKPMEVNKAVKSFPSSSSSAYPLYKKKDDPVNLRDCSSFVRRYLKNRSPKHLFKQPCTVFHRFQYKSSSLKSKFYPHDKISGGFKVSVDKKIRQVWALPHRVQSLEAVFFRELLDYSIQQNKLMTKPVWVAGLSLPGVSNKVISHHRLLSRRNNNVNVTFDISNYDSSVPGYFHARFCDLALKYSIDPLGKEDVVFDIFNYLCNTPFIKEYSDSFDGTIGLKFQRKGIPSGSLLTNCFGTFVNLSVVIYCLMESTNDKITEDQVVSTVSILGDDNLLNLQFTSRAKMISIYNSFGLTVSETKTEISNYSEKIPFIGYFWDKKNRPLQSISWYITHFCYPSSFLDVRKFDYGVEELNTYRAISVFMPLFHGLDNFNYLIGRQDRVWSKFLSLYNRGEDPVIYLTQNRQYVFNQRINMYIVLNWNWRQYNSLLNEFIDYRGKLPSTDLHRFDKPNGDNIVEHYYDSLLL